MWRKRQQLVQVSVTCCVVKAFVLVDLWCDVRMLTCLCTVSVMSETREMFRHFLRKSDGSVIEAFDTIEAEVHTTHQQSTPTRHRLLLHQATHHHHRAHVLVCGVILLLCRLGCWWISQDWRPLVISSFVIERSCRYSTWRKHHVGHVEWRNKTTSQ